MWSEESRLEEVHEERYSQDEGEESEVSRVTISRLFHVCLRVRCEDRTCEHYHNWLQGQPERPYHFWILVLMVELGLGPIMSSMEPTYHILGSWDPRGAIHLIQEMKPGNIGLLSLQEFIGNMEYLLLHGQLQRRSDP